MKEFKKPDLNAPRFRPIKTEFLNKTTRDAFRVKFPKYSSITDDEFDSVIREFNKQMWQGVIEYRDGIELPEGLGNVMIGTCKSPKIKYNTDFGTSIATNVLTRLKNYESDQFLAKIFYTNFATKYKFKFRELWEFKGDRSFTRTVSKAYREDWKKYIVVENTLLISKLYTKAKIKNWARDLPKEIDENYNEFNLD